MVGRLLLLVPGFDGFDGVLECLFQNTLADGSDDQTKQAPLEILALAHHDGVDVGHSVGSSRECVGVTGCAAPQVGVSCG